jgi:hypothetical protein
MYIRYATVQVLKTRVLVIHNYHSRAPPELGPRLESLGGTVRKIFGTSHNARRIFYLSTSSRKNFSAGPFRIDEKIFRCGCVSGVQAIAYQMGRGRVIKKLYTKLGTFTNSASSDRDEVSSRTFENLA